MKKLLIIYAGILIIVVGAGGGTWFYLNNSGKGEATEAAAYAVMDAAAAYKNWARDKAPHTLEVAVLILPDRRSSRVEPYSINVALDVEGKKNLFEVCSKTPLIHDVINMTFTGRLTPATTVGAELAAYDNRLKKELNAALSSEFVKQVRVTMAKRHPISVKGCS